MPTRARPTGTWFSGGSGVDGPDGSWMTEPLHGSGTVRAELDLEQTAGFKHDLDVAGHSSPADVSSPTVDRRPRAAVARRTDADATVPAPHPR